MLIGIWRSQRNDYLEFKEREVCKRGSYSESQGFYCSEVYLPYTIQGYRMFVDISLFQQTPSTVEWGWRVVDGELELSIGGTYTKIK